MIDTPTTIYATAATKETTSEHIDANNIPMGFKRVTAWEPFSTVTTWTGPFWNREFIVLIVWRCIIKADHTHRPEGAGAP